MGNYQHTREFLIKKEFGSLSVIDNDTGRSEIQVSFENTLKKLVPSYSLSEDEIDFDKIPEKFVLKCNHDSGSVKVITDKSKIDKDALEKFFEDRLKMNPYVFGREYPYKDVKPCIMAEKFMTPDGEEDINDYKFFCFNGKPEIMFIATDRSSDVKFDFFDMDFKHLDIVNIHEQSGVEIQKPEMFDEMKEIAAKISQGMKFVRIDLYEISGKIYFGEFTFFHGGGFWPMHPEKWEYELGKLIDIS